MMQFDGVSSSLRVSAVERVVEVSMWVYVHSNQRGPAPWYLLDARGAQYDTDSFSSADTSGWSALFRDGQQVPSPTRFFSVLCSHAQKQPATRRRREVAACSGAGISHAEGEWEWSKELREGREKERRARRLEGFFRTLQPNQSPCFAYAPLEL